MVIIKGEIPQELEEKFRRAIMEKTGMKRGAISKTLTEAVELWLQNYERNSQTSRIRERNHYNQIIDSHSEKYLIIDTDTSEVIAKGDDIVETYKKLRDQRREFHSLKLLSKQYCIPRRAQLNWRLRISSQLSNKGDG